MPRRLGRPRSQRGTRSTWPVSLVSSVTRPVGFGAVPTKMLFSRRPWAVRPRRHALGRAVAVLAAHLHLVVALGVDAAVAVHLPLRVAVDAGHALRVVHVGDLLGVRMPVEQVLLVGERLPALGRGLHHPAQVHRRAGAALVPRRSRRPGEQAWNTNVVIRPAT